MKHKKLFCIGMTLVMAFSVAALAACGEEGGPNNPTTPSGSTGKGSLKPTQGYEDVFPFEEDAAARTTSVAVHDPSVFYDEASETYYAFGTHYAVASSKDLIRWTQESSDNQWQKLYDSASVTYSGKQWPKALDDTLQIVQPAYNSDPTKIISTTWAPDVNYHDGKYYMYYSITKAFGSDQSAIGRVSSTDVMGPYSDNEVIIESVTTTESGHPNCIDPELFTDKNGGLWMVYGSFFGGIYVKELYNSGENWGLPKEEGWGKLLWKGGYNSIGVEGPFIYYNELTDYYYLMVSEDDLQTRYNMRVARSKNPDGPYTDLADKDVATSAGTGNKVAGNFKFNGANEAYVAIGHNSVVQDKDGRWFVVYHARHEAGGGHNLTVNQVFFNEAGWPVMSPVAYTGEKFGLISQDDAAGDYDIVIHKRETSADIINSEKYTLSADGKVTKGTAEAGTWSVKDNFYVTITVDNIEYKGVVVPGFNTYKLGTPIPVFAITAISGPENAGVSLWAIGERPGLV